MEQGSEEWFAARLGKVTASRIADVMAKTKTGYSAGRKNYAAQLVAERLSGQAPETFSSPAMRWGTETEPDARMSYEFYRDIEVKQTGFIDHPVIEMSGASPDGLVGDDGLVEIKCPNTATHIETLQGSSIDNKYLLQMQWQMECTGRKWCDFVSYDPRMPEEMRLNIQRVEFDPDLVAEIIKEVSLFLKEVEDTVETLISKYRKQAA